MGRLPSARAQARGAPYRCRPSPRPGGNGTAPAGDCQGDKVSPCHPGKALTRGCAMVKRPPAPVAGWRCTAGGSCRMTSVLNGIDAAEAVGRLGRHLPLAPAERLELLHRLLGEPACRQLGIYPIPAGFKLSV